MSKRFCLVAIAILVCVLSFANSSTLAITQSDSVSEPSETVSSENELKATIGFDGQFKLGRWAPIFFTGKGSQSASKFRVVVPDGNGRPIAFTGPVLSAKSGQPQGWLKIGRGFGSVSIELFDDTDSVISSSSLQLGTKAARPLDPTLPVVLTIENSNVLNKAVKPLEGQVFKSASTVIGIETAKQLPVCSLAYDGVQVIYLSTSDVELFQSISAEQLDAIEAWVRNGGKLFFCAGINADKIFAQPNGISRFLPGKFDAQIDLASSQQIERYTVSKQPLLTTNDQPLKATQLTDITGIAEPEGARQPTVVRQAFGFGQIIFATVDLDVSPISEWSGLNNFCLLYTSDAADE